MNEKLQAKVNQTVHLRVNNSNLITGKLEEWQGNGEYVVNCVHFNAKDVTFADSFSGEEAFYILVYTGVVF